MAAKRIGFSEADYQTLNEILRTLSYEAQTSGVVFVETADFILAADQTDAGLRLYGKKKVR
jgi:hypothetical protein